MKTSGPRIFYGWWVVLSSALGLFLGPIPIVLFSFGVFLHPLIREFHSNRGDVSMAITAYSLIMALGLPVAGRLSDRFGPRNVILPSTFIAGSILLSAYRCSGHIWQLYLLYSAIGVASCGVAAVSYGHIISRWFDQRRGLALGAMMTGLGFGGLVMPFAAQYLISTFDWRTAFGAAGAAILIITMPVLTVFLKESPTDMGLLPDGSAEGTAPLRRVERQIGLSLSEAWRTPDFWPLFCAVILVSASFQACFAHMAAILADRGASAEIAALGTSLLGGGLLIGRAASGYLIDRCFAPRVAAVVFSCAAAGIGLLRIANSQGPAFAAAFLIGLGVGAEVDIMAYLTTRYFGIRSFGAIYGSIFTGFSLSGGLGQYLMGATFDTTGSYSFALTLFLIAALAGAAIMLRLGPYRYEGTRKRHQTAYSFQPLEAR
jgi:MFS family permease